MIVTSEQEKEIRHNAKLELARYDFWTYCNCRIPTFYKYDRPYLIDLCNVMQALYEGRIRKESIDSEWIILDRSLFYDQEGDYPTYKRFNEDPELYRDWIVCTKLIVNLPPRHGKSLTAQLFSEWCFGIEQSNRIITISYNETLSGRFSKFVRDGISATRVDDSRIVFSDIFPGISIKKGDAAAQLWGLEGQYMSYLGGSPTGTLTGMGCCIGIIDDLIKNKAEAFNDRTLENHYEFYGDTYLSRLEEGHIQIFIMTRWSTKDICGRLIKEAPEEFYVHEVKAMNEKTHEMLCPTVLSFKSFEEKKKFTSPAIINANYQQKPIDDEGRLYKRFMLYDQIPKDDKGNPIWEMVMARFDTADQGSDFLSGLAVGIYQKQAYILDILYSDAGMEVTEPLAAGFCIRNGIRYVLVESNNGGKGWARAVRKHVHDGHKHKNIKFEWFHESRNKISRIQTNSWSVMERLYWPRNWHDRWPAFFEAMVGYQKEGKNLHDDAPDVCTGVIEYMDNDVSGKLESVAENDAQTLIDKLSRM